MDEGLDSSPQGAFELLPEATQRLVRTVDGLDDAALAAPSGLPDWTRAHVVAHLALNAEGLARVLTSRTEGRPTSMYRSDEARDGDIDDLAAADAGRAARPVPGRDDPARRRDRADARRALDRDRSNVRRVAG